MRNWHHATQLQFKIAQRMGLIVHATTGGWLIWATDHEFTTIVIAAGEV